MRNQCVILLSSLLLVTAGCAVHEHKSGDTENVQIHTPVGGMDVRTNATHAADLGLPVYPGALQVTGDNGDSKSADINMSFAGFRLHVQAVHYHSGDPQDKVADFYKKAMAQYGDVVTCKDHKPVGEPAKTQLGLTCENGHKIYTKGDLHAGDEAAGITRSGNFQLIAGSTANQRIVSFKPSQSGCDFALIVLQLPHRGQTD